MPVRSDPPGATAEALFPELETESEPRGAPDSPPRGRGVLPSQDIRKLIADGAISAPQPVEDRQIQPASLDLRLGAVAYRLQASFLPGSRATVGDKLQHLSMTQLDLSSPTVLERGCV